jgi:hypothetical protein
VAEGLRHFQRAAGGVGREGQDHALHVALAGIPAVEGVAVVGHAEGQARRRSAMSRITGAEKPRSTEGTGSASMPVKASCGWLP